MPGMRCEKSSVHPRTGGEHSSSTTPSPIRFGSSPHGRGTHPGGRWAGGVGRFIPARAGNTASRERVLPPGPVHPRTGGEHMDPGTVPSRTAGSSPHGRGTRVQHPPGVTLRRFIPARAGNTPSCTINESASAVHPRTGGEHWYGSREFAETVGSSPHGRGTRSAPGPNPRG